MRVKSTEIEWEPFEGGAEASPEIDGEDYELLVTGQERTHTAYYSASMPNARSWTVGVYGGEGIAYGTSDGLRAAKKDALAALNTYLAEHGD